jgi:hypothetical protein
MTHHDKWSTPIKANNALLTLAQDPGPSFNGVLRHITVHDPGDVMPNFQRTWARIVGCDLWMAIVRLRARAAGGGSQFYTTGNNAHSM